MRNAKPTLSEETTCGRWNLRPPIRKFQCVNFLFKTKGVSCFFSVSILAVERLTIQFDSWGSLVFWFFCFRSNLSCFLLEAMSWKELSPDFETGGRPSKRQTHSAIYHPESHSMVIFGGRSLNSLLTLRLFPTACTEPRFASTIGRPWSTCGTQLQQIYVSNTFMPLKSMDFSNISDDHKSLLWFSEVVWVMCGHLIWRWISKRRVFWGIDVLRICSHKTCSFWNMLNKAKGLRSWKNTKKQTLHVWKKPSLILWGFDVVAIRLKPQSQLLSNFAEAMSWKELHPTGTAPSARHDSPAIYDPPSHSMVVFGGESLPLNLLTLTWVLFWAVLRVSFFPPAGQRPRSHEKFGPWERSFLDLPWCRLVSPSGLSCHAFLRQWCVGIGFEGHKSENLEQTVSGDLRLYPDMTDILCLVKWP